MPRKVLTRNELIECGLMDYKWWIISGFTILHLLITVTLFITSFNFGWPDLDLPHEKTLLEGVTEILDIFMMSPAYQLAHYIHLGRYGYLLFIANSMFWAICWYTALRVMLRRRILAHG